MNTKDIPVYGLGTWLMGGAKERDKTNNDQADIDAIRMHLDMGVKQIFTAQNYADTYTETLVGRVLNGYKRDDFMINTAERKENSAFDDMIRSVEGSLERLQVEYLDVVVHHAPIPEVKIAESVKALNEIVNRGLAKGFAVSNYNSVSMQKALDATEIPILFNQVYYNLFIREIEEDGLLELCKDNEVIIQAYRPLELGELATVNNELLKELAQKYELTQAQVALSWLTSQEGVAVIATTHNKKHLEENLLATKVVISDEDVELLRSSFPVKNPEKTWIR